MSGKKYTSLDFDIALGKVIMMTRQRMGLTQKDLGDKIGVSFQQVQKYETAGNRVAVSRLAQIAAVFDMTPGQLLDGVVQQYVHDEKIMNLINLMYRTNDYGRRLVLNVARSVAQAYACNENKTDVF